MSAWRRISLGNISRSIDYGVTASAEAHPAGPKFLRITDIQDGNVNWQTVPWCSSDARSLEKSRLVAGDIVFARTGATTGKSFLIRECPENAVFASYLIRVRLSDEADPSYVAHFFKTPDYWRQITSSARGAGQPGVNATSLKKIELPLPPLKEQRRIAAILDKAEDMFAKRRQAIAKLDSLAQAIFLEMFGDPISNPKSWPIKTLTEACYCYSGGTPSKADEHNWHGTLPWFSPKDMKKEDLFDSQDHINEDLVRTSSLKLIPPNTVSIVVRGMILAHTFPVAVIRVPSTINQDMKALLPRERMDPQFLANCIRCQAPNVLHYVSEAGHGTKRIDADGLAKICIPSVPQKLQDIYAETVTKIETIKEFQHEYLARIEMLIESVRHRAFRGEL